MNNQTILCATDFSESSLQALKWALRTAKETHAAITVLFCYRLIAGDDDKAKDLKKNMEKEALKKFHDLEKKLINGQQVSYHFVAEVGFFSSRIETFLSKSPVGMLVMGNSIVQNFDEYKNLSFEQFLKNTKVPVVIIPE